jgi:hypothetical protein
MFVQQTFGQLKVWLVDNYLDKMSVSQTVICLLGKKHLADRHLANIFNKHLGNKLVGRGTNFRQVSKLTKCQSAKGFLTKRHDTIFLETDIILESIRNSLNPVWLYQIIGAC